MEKVGTTAAKQGNSNQEESFLNDEVIEQSNESKGESADSASSEGEEYEPGDSESQYEDPPKRRKKPKPGYSDPFSIPPNDITEDVFKAIHPFVMHTDYIPEHCRYGGPLQMDPKALNVVMDVALNYYVRNDRDFPRAKGEMERRIKQAALFGVRDFTKISSEAGREKKRKKIYAEDLKIEIGARSSNESLANDHDKTARSDFRISVKDNRGIKHAKQGRKRKWADLEEPWRLVIAADCKDKEGPEVVRQALSSSTSEIQENLRNGHVDPVIALGLSAGMWTYAMLEVDGIVELRNGAITLSSYQDYRRTAKLRYFRLLKQKIPNDSPFLWSMEELTARLLERVKVYRAQYIDKPNASYPDGCYLWYSLPNPRELGALASHGAKMFYEGLMRSVVGERVLDWKESDALQACKARGSLDAELKAMGGLTECWELMPTYRFYNTLPDGQKAEFDALLKRIDMKWS